jgi:hypothetical protein
VASHLESVADGEVGLLAAPAKTLMSSGPRDSEFLGRFFQQKNSGACPPLVIHSRVEGSLQVRLKGYLEALCKEVCGLTDKW